MAADEVQALKLAMSAASAAGGPHRASYYISLNDDEWVVHLEASLSFRISQSTGVLIPDDQHLDAAEALSVAREYASSRQLNWVPSFSVEPASDGRGWAVGARQSRLGGQLHIRVGYDGRVLGHWVNPK